MRKGVSLERAVREVFTPKVGMKRQRTGRIYDTASAAALRSAGGYRSGILGRVYTRDQLLARGSADGFVDEFQTLYPDNDPTNLFLIATVGQGSSTQERVGRKITWKGMDIRMVWKGATDSGVPFDRVRCAIVYDTQPGGSLPSVTDIYETMNIWSHRKESGFERFRVLKEFRITTIGNSDDVSSPPPNYAGQKRKYLKINKEARYAGGTSGDIGDISKGALYFVYQSDTSSVDPQERKMQIQINFRTHFRDVLA